MFKLLANAVRFLSIAEVASANSGHLGMALGISDCLTVLFQKFLVFDPKNPKWPNRDRFVLSGGHASPVLYALLYLTGYEKMSLEQLKNFRKLGSHATGHPEYDLECGIEATTGALGQGIANAVGMAIEERILNARFGDECINHYTYVCAGEGDLMEGIAHEACVLAGNLSLGHLIIIFDSNNTTIDGKLNISTSEDTLKRFESYGWQVLSIDGHSEKEIEEALTEAKIDPRPSIIECKTKIGFGTPREGLSKAHSGALSEEELEETRKNLNWKYEFFKIPENVLENWRSAGARSHKICENWYKTQSEKFGSEKFEYLESFRKTFRTLKKEYWVSRPFKATRSSSKEIISKIMQESNLIIAGSADLGSSTGCLSSEMKPISASDFSGNYLHYGIREHAMGAIMNGMVAGGKLRCFAGTFLVFSDYMRPAIRMSALMNIPTIYIFSHDSIGVGEDGPTHQPIEHLASLRSIPNLNVFRPADAMETLECWENALKSSRPSVLVLSRQELLCVRFCGRTNLCENGAYLLYEDTTENEHQTVTLIASGSEVGIALEIKKMLTDNGISSNVVSVPCWNLFDEQPIEYREHVLGDGLRVGIEASNGFGWEKYLGDHGMFFGVNDFGKSCSGPECFKFFGLTSENIYKKILARLKK